MKQNGGRRLLWLEGVASRGEGFTPYACETMSAGPFLPASITAIPIAARSYGIIENMVAGEPPENRGLGFGAPGAIL